jgi:hypothetical protein
VAKRYVKQGQVHSNQLRSDGYPIFLRDKEWGVTEADLLGPQFKIEFNSVEVEKILWVKLTANTTSIRRMQDLKIVGKVTGYSRVGGGVPLSESAGKVCPTTDVNIWKLIQLVFIDSSQSVAFL